MVAARADLRRAVPERLAEVRRRIEAAGGDPTRVKVVAVTKGFGAEAVEAAVSAGLLDLGENYAQELLSKAPAAPAEVRWHFLGVLQRNKLRRLAPVVSVWEALDRDSAIKGVAALQPGAAAFLEVNVAGEPAKHGCRPEEAPRLAEACRSSGLDLQGLMTVAPLGDREAAASCFKALASLGRALGLAELSMGMSDDYEEAVAAGATVIRLGRALFGPRPGPAGVGE